jgi:hypothetical protein
MATGFYLAIEPSTGKLHMQQENGNNDPLAVFRLHSVTKVIHVLIKNQFIDMNYKTESF